MTGGLSPTTTTAINVITISGSSLLLLLPPEDGHAARDTKPMLSGVTSAY